MYQYNLMSMVRLISSSFFLSYLIIIISCKRHTLLAQTRNYTYMEAEFHNHNLKKSYLLVRTFLEVFQRPTTASVLHLAEHRLVVRWTLPFLAKPKPLCVVTAADTRLAVYTHLHGCWFVPVLKKRLVAGVWTLPQNNRRKRYLHAYAGDEEETRPDES